MADDDAIFNLLDSCWFHRQILNKEPHASTSQQTPPVSTPTSATSMDELGGSFTCFSPSSVLPSARLPTIFSGKVAADSSPELPSRAVEKVLETDTPRNRGIDHRIRRKKKLQRGVSKSLSDLDFVELKGFIDLGFSFSEEDKNSEFLSTILPGLQSLGLEEQIQKEEEEKKKRAMKAKEEVGRRRRSVDESGYSRPNYLKMQRRKNNALKTTSMVEIPALGSEINMKDYLKSWAHSVASSVR